MGKRRPSRVAARRAPLAWGAIGALVAGGLCFVPLFDLVGYELALAIAPLAAIAALHLALRRVARRRAAASFAAREAADVAPLRALAGLALGGLVDAVPLLVAPLVVVGLNGLRVRNCNPAIGLAWYAILPLASAAFAAALGAAIGVLAPRATGRLALPVAIAVALGALAASLARLYRAPPIFVFDPIFGYFAGSLYDEHVAIPRALGWARAYHVAIAAAALAVAAWLLDGHALAARPLAARGRRRAALRAAALIAAAAALYRLGPTLGYRHDAGSIAAALGGERRTDHFVLHFRPDGAYGRELDDVALELELRHALLRERLGIAPARPVHAYLFDSAEEKQRLMGAGHTYIAKPWRGEIYVNHEAFPQAVLAHELAHVFGAAAGDPLLGVARRGLRLDVGLIEGFAEAVTWHGASLVPDEQARVLDLLDRLPALDTVMSPAFWSLPAQQAYAVAGSFCHFLLERAGAPALVALYRAGGARDAYRAIYGASFDALSAEWLAAIRRVVVPPEVLARERERLLRPSIFRRPCAHEVARRVEAARASAARGDHETARRLYAQVCADEPDDPGHLDELLGETARAGRAADAADIGERLLAHPKTTAAQRGVALAALGDLRALAGAPSAAAALYARAERHPADEAVARLYTVKRLLAERAADAAEPVRRGSRAALAALAGGGVDADEELAAITRAAADAPADPLLAYLAARQLAARARRGEARRLLARALAGPLPDERFAREARRLDGELAFRERDYAGAAAAFDRLAEVGTPAQRLDAALWATRARFFGARRAAAP